MRYRIPPLSIPTNPELWEGQRISIRSTLMRLLGELPPPIVPLVETVATERGPGFVAEKFRFHNGDHLSGLGAIVSGILLIPNDLSEPAPAVQYYHAHGGKFKVGKDELWDIGSRGTMQALELTSRGYIVCAIDAQGFGDRHGTGPGGPDDMFEEDSTCKRDLWYGRTLWGMRLRDEAMALTYLIERPEVDSDRIGAIGMSMGSTRVWWRMALDERIKVGVALACLTRYQDLIDSQALECHALYYYIPGMLRHFDSEAVVALCAPRSLLCVTGDEDRGSPASGVEKITDDVKHIYRILGVPERFRSILLPEVGHEWSADMWDEAIDWFAKWL